MFDKPQNGNTSPIIRPAATIMLLRETNEGIKVLLLKRNEALKFAPGYWVFPGGKIELPELEQTTSVEAAARLAAIRETVEETGIHVKEIDLTHYVHWTTPKGGNRRFGTWFFYAWTDAVDVQVDGSEIIDYQWLTVAEAFERLQDKKLPILPPTYISMLRISTLRSRDEIDQEMASDIPNIIPQTTFVDGVFYSFYEGDVARGSLEYEKSGPRHRIIGDLKNGTYEFQYRDCDHIFPVSGRSVLK